MNVQKFQGGKSWMARAGIIGVLALAATFAGMMKDPKTALYSYLVAFAFWAGISFCALILLMIFHAFHAKWMVVIRRPLETMASTIWIFALLFIPIALGMQHLYSWVHPGHGQFNHEELHFLHHKEAYLNVPFFVVRTGVYLLIAFFLAQRLFGLSTKQDATGDAELTVKQRRLSAGGLPFMAIVISFAAFDWLMTLNPLWFSTIFGVYYFAGGFVSTVCMLVLVTVFARGKDQFGSFVSAEHSHNLGKLMFAFTCFWAYIGFSQFMLIWIAGLPEEIPFYLVRMRGPWAVVGVILILGHFALPFLVLISRNIKRNPVRLVPMAIWILAMNFVDLYWLTIPTLTPEGPSFHWSLLTAFLGIGGIVITAAIWRARGHFTVPVKDPFLSFSLRYKQP